MELYILRHGIAEDEKPGHPDSERALTQEGRKKLRKVLKAARDVNVRPSLIVTSPFRRAFETAEIAAEILEYPGHLLPANALLPTADPSAAWEEIRVHQDEPQVLIAGHEPLFSALAAYLLHSPDLRVDFKKGALMRVDLDRFSAEPRGVLKWMLAPKLA